MTADKILQLNRRGSLSAAKPQSLIAIPLCTWLIIPYAVSKVEEANHDEFLSPVEERHIDYILEEEFSVNPDFLRFFVAQAGITAGDKSRIVGYAEESDCIAVRSATTAQGETDLLVKYGANNGALPTAILIEDKIRAGFQPDQAKRYRERGDEGKGQEWSQYWTCLVAHAKYPAEKGDFDAVVSLEALHEYFAIKTDERSRFRTRVLEQTIRKFEATGIQSVDPGMTRFRAMYSAECAKVLEPGRWVYDKARDAWWDDTWFFFRCTAWPKGVQIRHQARTGLIGLILPVSDPTPLREVVKQCVAQYPRGSGRRIDVVPVGKSKYAFQIDVPKVVDVSFDAEPPEFEDFFAAIDFLAGVYEKSSDLLPEALRADGEKASLPQEDRDFRALRAMVLGFMRSTVTCLGTQMPYPLPDLRLLTGSMPEKDRYFASPGLMGGFLLELREDERHNRYVISEYWSRQWGSFSVRHKITPSEVVALNEGA